MQIKVLGDTFSMKVLRFGKQVKNIIHIQENVSKYICVSKMLELTVFKGTALGMFKALSEIISKEL